MKKYQSVILAKLICMLLLFAPMIAIYMNLDNFESYEQHEAYLSLALLVSFYFYVGWWGYDNYHAPKKPQCPFYALIYCLGFAPVYLYWVSLKWRSRKSQ